MRRRKSACATHRRALAEAALAWNTLVWGATFVLVKSALLDISPFLFLALRFSLATLALAAVLAASGRLRFRWKEAAAGALAGSFLFSGYAFQTLGLRLTSPSQSAFLTGLSSVMVPLLASLVYRNRPRASEVAGVLVATAGLGLMTLHGAIGSISRGDLLTLLGAAGFAAYIVVLGHFSECMSFEGLALSQIAVAGIWPLALLGWTETPHVLWRPAVLWAILVTGILATGLAFTIQAWAQQYTTSTRTALIYMLEPVFAWMTSFFVLGEGLSGRAAAGAALILGGILVVELKPLR
jgi:drug/metabolite transporter (DMT)-like permease